MKKENLINLISRAKRVEEDAVMNLSSHINAACEWLKDDPQNMEKIKNGLKILHDESNHHKEMLDEILAKIEQLEQTDI